MKKIEKKAEKIEDYGEGQEKGDWVQDIAGVSKECTEQKCYIECGQPFWVQGERLLCANCITLVLNAREDRIKDLEYDNAEYEKQVWESGAGVG